MALKRNYHSIKGEAASCHVSVARKILRLEGMLLFLRTENRELRSPPLDPVPMSVTTDVPITSGASWRDVIIRFPGVFFARAMTAEDAQPAGFSDGWMSPGWSPAGEREFFS